MAGFSSNLMLISLTVPVVSGFSLVHVWLLVAASTETMLLVLVWLLFAASTATMLLGSDEFCLVDMSVDTEFVFRFFLGINAFVVSSSF